MKAKTDAARWLMQEQAAELSFIGFGETHVAGHYLWSADLEGEAKRLLPSPMLPVYE